MSGFKYFDIQPILSRNALMTFIISSRGAGKTYSSKEHILKRFNNKGHKFLFLKRTETELDATADGFWDDFATGVIDKKWSTDDLAKLTHVPAGPTVNHFK